MLSGGSITIARVRGVPIRVHWTTLLGALVFTRSIDPMVWVAFCLVVVVHELGHAALVRRCGYRVTAIEVNGLGGHCQWEGDATAKHDALIAWGGVLAQALLLVGTLIVLALTGAPPGFMRGLAWVFTSVNAWMMLINLIPVPPLDGARAWPLLAIVAAERGFWRPTYGAPRTRPTRAWSRSAEWLQRLDAERRRKARAAAQKEARKLDEADQEEAPPIPDEIREEIARILDEGRSSPRPKDPPDKG